MQNIDIQGGSRKGAMAKAWQPMVAKGNAIGGPASEVAARLVLCDILSGIQRCLMQHTEQVFLLCLSFVASVVVVGPNR